MTQISFVTFSYLKVRGPPLFKTMPMAPTCLNPTTNSTADDKISKTKLKGHDRQAGNNESSVDDKQIGTSNT